MYCLLVESNLGSWFLPASVLCCMPSSRKVFQVPAKFNARSTLQQKGVPMACRIDEEQILVDRSQQEYKLQAKLHAKLQSVCRSTVLIRQWCTGGPWGAAPTRARGSRSAEWILVRQANQPMVSSLSRDSPLLAPPFFLTDGPVFRQEGQGTTQTV